MTEPRCLACDVVVYPRRYCSEACRHRAELRRRSARRSSVRYQTTKVCPICDTEFLAPRTDAVYCSKRCLKRGYTKRHPGHGSAAVRRWRARNGNPPYGELRRSADARRRARKRGARVETFSRTDLAERDGWRCRLCHHMIDPYLAWPHPLSPSIDHLVPLALGGEHSLANTQLAHLVCNTRKGVKPAGEQLRLA